MPFKISKTEQKLPSEINEKNAQWTNEAAIKNVELIGSG